MAAARCGVTLPVVSGAPRGPGAGKGRTTGSIVLPSSRLIRDSLSDFGWLTLLRSAGDFGLAEIGPSNIAGLERSSGFARENTRLPSSAAFSWIARRRRISSVFSAPSVDLSVGCGCGVSV